MAATTKDPDRHGRAGYDLFLSHSSADQQAAELVKATMGGLGRSRVRRSPTRIFLDTSSLSGSPNLGQSISEALTDSSWLLLLASPDSASSVWVRREIQHWNELGREDRLLLGIVAGTPARASAPIDWTTDANELLPPGVVADPSARPTFDFRQDGFDSAGTRFLEESIRALAVVRGVEPQLIEAEDRMVKRRWRRRTRMATAVAAALLCASVIGTAVTLAARDRLQRDTLEARRSQLISLSEQETFSNPQQSSLRAVIADAIRSAPESLRALSGVLDQRAEAHLIVANEAIDVVALSPDGSRAATVDRAGVLYVVSLATMEVENTIAGVSEKWILRLRWLDSDRVLIADVDGAVSSVDVVNEHTTELIAGDEAASPGAFGPHGEYVRRFRDGLIESWATSSTVQLLATTTLASNAARLTFSADGSSIGVARKDGVVELLRAQTLESIRASGPLLGDGESFHDIAISSDGQIATTYASGVSILNPEDFEPTSVEVSSEPLFLAWSPDSSSLAITSDHGVTLYDARARTLGLRSSVTGGSTGMVTWSPSGDRIYAAATDGSLWSWLPHSPFVGSGPLPIAGKAYSVSVSPSQALIAIAGKSVTFFGLDGRPVSTPTSIPPPSADSVLLDVVFDEQRSAVIIADAAGIVFRTPLDSVTGRQQVDLKAGVLDLDLDPDGSYVAAALDSGAVAILDGNSLSEVARVEAGERYALGVAFSADGATLATSSRDGRLKFWRTSDWTLLGESSAGALDLGVVTWSLDQRSLYVAADDGTIRVFDAETAAVTTTFRGPTEADLYSLSLSPNGRLLIAGDSTGRLWLWDTRAGELLGGPLSEHLGSVYSVEWLDDTHVVSIALEGIVWTIDPTQWHQLACERLARFDLDELWAVAAPDVDRRSVC